MAMELSSLSAKRLFKQPGTFALAVIKQFRANQGVLLAGAVAYYTLLSLVPLLILILLALSHIVDEFWSGLFHSGEARLLALLAGLVPRRLRPHSRDRFFTSGRWR